MTNANALPHRKSLRPALLWATLCLILLGVLLSAPGHAFTRDQLLARLHDDPRSVNDRAVDSHIKNLRRKLEAVDPQADLIRSVYGVGFRLELSR